MHSSNRPVYFLLIVFACLSISSCNNTVKKNIPTAVSKPFDTLSYNNDSLLISTETKGHIVYKHYKDTAKVKKDNFDNSFSVKSVYKKLFNSKSLSSDFHFTEGNFDIFFNSADVLNYCSNSLDKLKIGPGNADLSKERYLKLIAFVDSSIDGKKPADTDEYWLPTLLLKCNFVIKETKTKFFPSFLLVEDYETEFSGGNNFYLVMPKNDTINFFANDELDTIIQKIIYKLPNNAIIRNSNRSFKRPESKRLYS